MEQSIEENQKKQKNLISEQLWDEGPAGSWRKHRGKPKKQKKLISDQLWDEGPADPWTI